MMDSELSELRRRERLAGSVEPLYVRTEPPRQDEVESITRALIDRYEPPEPVRPVCLCLQMLRPVGLSPQRHDNLGPVLHGFVQGVIVGAIGVLLGVILGLQLSTVQIVGIAALTFYNFISPSGITAP